MQWNLHLLEDDLLRKHEDEGAVELLAFDLMRKEYQRAQFEVQLYGDAIEQWSIGHPACQFFSQYFIYVDRYSQAYHIKMHAPQHSFAYRLVHSTNLISQAYPYHAPCQTVILFVKYVCRLTSLCYA